MREEREVLTRAIIQQKMIREAKRPIVGVALMFPLCVVVYGAMLLLLLIPASDSKLIPIVVTVPFAVLLAVLVIRARAGFVQLGKARRGEFSIVEDSLTKMEDDKFSFKQFLLRFDIQFPIITKDYYNHVFEFESGKKFIVNAGEYQNTHIGTVAQFSQAGDKLIVVFYDDEPEKIIMLFSPKIYKYKA